MTASEIAHLTGATPRLLPPRHTKQSRYLAATVALCATVLASAQGSVAAADTSPAMAGLSGRWTGAGVVTPTSGPVEDFKCVATYFPSDDGARMRQHLRCHSPNYQMESRTELNVSGDRVTGTWEETSNALKGSVAGKVTADGFDLMLTNQFFKARMVVVSSRCEQSVTVTPVKTEYVREVAASLKKC